MDAQIARRLEKNDPQYHHGSQAELIQKLKAWIERRLKFWNALRTFRENNQQFATEILGAKKHRNGSRNETQDQRIMMRNKEMSKAGPSSPQDYRRASNNAEVLAVHQAPSRGGHDGNVSPRDTEKASRCHIARHG